MHHALTWAESEGLPDKTGKSSFLTKVVQKTTESGKNARKRDQNLH
jgi:hypothetical protein